MRLPDALVPPFLGRARAPPGFAFRGGELGGALPCRESDMQAPAGKRLASGPPQTAETPSSSARTP